MGLTFGEVYNRLSSSALAEVHDRLPPPGSIVDFGAGCGRLTIPLSRSGYRVTAVDPSNAMLAQLESRSGDLSIRTADVPMQSYRAAQPHDLALCVFTVIAYLVEDEALSAAFVAVRDSLTREGLFLLDVPHQSVFESLQHDSAEIIRNVEIEPIGGSIFSYREDTLVRTRDGSVRYRDAFRLRRWTTKEVRHSLEEAGFVEEDDVSERFEGLGADYLLMRRVG